MTFSLEAFHRGVQEARASIEDANDYTYMIHGLARAMQANGREVAPMDLASRWHDPLCGTRPKDLEDPSEMFRVMGFGGNFGFERMVQPNERFFDDRYGSNPLDHLYDKLRGLDNEEAIEYEAKVFFDVEYKSKWPDKRRGTKHYKETWERVRVQAVSIKRGERIAEAKSTLKEAERRASSKQYDGCWFSRMQSAKSTAEGYLVRVADLEALGVESEWISKLKDLAADLFRRAEEAEERVLDRLAEARAKIAEAESKLLKEVACA